MKLGETYKCIKTEKYQYPNGIENIFTKNKEYVVTDNYITTDDGFCKFSINPKYLKKI